MAGDMRPCSCGNSFTKRGLAKHIKTCPIEIRRIRQEYHAGQGINPTKTADFQCPECNWPFTYDKDLKRHLKDHGIERDKPRSETPYRCHHCNAGYVAEPQYKNHERNCYKGPVEVKLMTQLHDELQHPHQINSALQGNQHQPQQELGNLKSVLQHPRDAHPAQWNQYNTYHQSTGVFHPHPHPPQQQQEQPPMQLTSALTQPPSPGSSPPPPLPQQKQQQPRYK